LSLKEEHKSRRPSRKVNGHTQHSNEEITSFRMRVSVLA